MDAASPQVELDVLTGDMHVLRSDLVMDVGNPLNPAIDIGQVGGVHVDVLVNVNRWAQNDVEEWR